MNPNVAMFLSFVVVSVFTLLSVAAWASARERERKEFYRTELLKKLAESGQAALMEYLRNEETRKEREKAELRRQMMTGTKSAGLIAIAVGGMLMVVLHQLVPNYPVYLIGGIPLAVGVVMLGMGLFSRPNA